MRQATRVLAALALVALGGLAGFALGAPHGDATANGKRPPIEVRTQVIRHTIRIHRKPKAPRHPPRSAAPAGAAPPRPVVVAQQPSAAVAPAAPAHAPVRTRTSGAGGAGGAEGGEHEHEHEGGDD